MNQRNTVRSLAAAGLSVAVLLVSTPAHADEVPMPGTGTVFEVLPGVYLPFDPDAIANAELGDPATISGTGDPATFVSDGLDTFTTDGVDTSTAIAADPEGGSGGGRDCTGYHWNDGTAAGNTSIPMSVCLGDAGSQTLSGTTMFDGDDYGDVIQGRAGNDILYGGAGNDILYGDWAQDTHSGDGSDTIYGGTGNDDIFGGRGTDYLYGGPGADSFYTRDGYRDYIHCADSRAQAQQEAGTLGSNGSRDYVEYDRYDVLDSSCDFAKKSLG